MTYEPTAPAPLVGRELELATFAAALAEVRGGDRRVVLVEGDAGMGKTALVRAALRDERCTLVWASGDEHEIDVDLGVVDQLVRDAPLDAGAADDLRSTMQGGDALRTGASLVGLLDGLHINPQTPLVVVIDDAQWADAASLRALTFAARRLKRDPVMLCVIVRAGAQNLPDGLVRLSEHDGLTIRLSPLDRSAIQQIASSTLRTDISSQAANRLREHTEGSPLHLNALLQELTPAMVSGGGELPAPRSFSTLVLSRLGGAPPQTEELVAAVAVLGDPVPLSVAARLAQVDEPLAPLDHAVENGLLEVVTTAHDPSRLQIAIPHPLVRAAVLGDLPPGRLAQLHRLAGTQLGGLTGLRHRLLGAVGPDEELWEEAIGAARAEAERGAHGSAAALFRESGSVAPSEAAREQMLIESLNQLLLAGRLDDALSLRPVLEGAEPSALRSFVAGRLAYVVGPRRTAEGHLDDAWSRLMEDLGEGGLSAAGPDDRRQAGRVAAMLATVKVDRGDGSAAIRWCERAQELAPRQAALASTAHMLASAHALTGDMPAGLARLDQSFDALSAEPDAGLEMADLRSARGLLRLWTHDLRGAVEDLSASLEAAGRLGSFVARETARSYLAEAHYRQGHWDKAVLLGEVVASIVDDADHGWMAVLPHASVARPLAARGEDAAADHLAVAQAAAEAIGVGVMLGLARVAAIEVAVCARDHAAALELGELVLGAGQLADERIVPWRANLVESLVASGQRRDAAALVEQLAQHPQPSLLTVTDSARAAVVLAEAEGRPDAVDAAAEAGLSLDADLVGPYPRARLELVVGRAWRHRGDRRKAAAVLEQARRRFDALGARPWLTQVDHELTASGLKPARRSMSASADLTRQEAAVARLVAQGMTNREAAAELVVSAKTVEHHLSRVYAKIGVRSRTELAARMSQS